MDAIVKFFAAIGDFIVSIFDFIVSFFSDLVYMIRLIGIFVAQIPTYFSFLPDGMVTLVVLIFGVVFLYKILGREG